jgi:hypothetical protein
MARLSCLGQEICFAIMQASDPLAQTAALIVTLRARRWGFATRRFPSVKKKVLVHESPSGKAT